MPAQNRTPTVPSAGFLATVKESGVLTDQQFLRAVAELPDDARTGRDAARALVESGLLTQFQADRLLAGRTGGFVLGQYLILDQIALGPTGRVYKALHRAMNRPVAVKLLPADQTRDPVRRAALLEEAKAAARLAHPNVVTVLDANQHGDRFYLVLEYVEGFGADALVRESGPPAVARACEVARQAALGLQHAHDKGVCHGALTPGCLLIEARGVKLANFGSGRATGAPLVGFPAASDPADYLAPELFDPLAAPTPRSDLYSLGGVLYFLLTGRTPFPALAAEDKARHHRTSDPVPVADLRPDVPPEVAALVADLLAKDPAARPESAADVAARLEPFGEPAGPASPGEFYVPGSTAIPPPGYREALVLTPAPTGTVVDSSAHLTPTTLTAAVADTCPWAGLGDGHTLAEEPPLLLQAERRKGLTVAVAVGVAVVLAVFVAVIAAGK